MRCLRFHALPHAAKPAGRVRLVGRGFAAKIQAQVLGALNGTDRDKERSVFRNAYMRLRPVCSIGRNGEKQDQSAKEAKNAHN